MLARGSEARRLWNASVSGVALRWTRARAVPRSSPAGPARSVDKHWTGFLSVFRGGVKLVFFSHQIIRSY